MVSLALTLPATAQSSHWLTGYYATYNYGVMSTSQLDYTKLTHVIYWPVIPNSGPAGSATAPGTLNTTPFGLSATTFSDGATDLVTRAHAAGAKALIGIGGDQSSGATAGFQISTTSKYQATFIKNIVALMQQYGFDGVDINWEQIQASDNTDFTTFIANLRAALTTASPNTHLLLTMPPETKPNGGRPDLLALVYQDLDQINIQTYQMSGPYCGWETWYNSPLNNGGATFIEDPSEPLPSATNAIADYTAVGIPVSKLAMGIQFDSSVWTGGQGTSTGGVTQPKQTWTNDNSCSANPDAPSYGTLPYRTMIVKLAPAPGYTTNFDSTADQSWLSYDPSGTGTKNENEDSFVSFDSPTSIAKKGVDMSASAGAGGTLGGVFIFELSGDYAPTAPAAQQHPLLNAAHSMQMLLPGLITNLKATAGTASTTLTWTAATGAASYNVAYATNANGPYTAAPSVTTNQATIDNLRAGQEYWFTVQAVNAFGTGVVSPQVTATILGIVPVLNWVYLDPIAYGTPLTSYDELDAVATDPTGNGLSKVPGTYVYNPGAGTVLPAGTHTLSVTFTPTSPTYAIVSKSVSLTVTPATLSNSNNFGSIELTQESNAQAILIYFTAADTIASIQTLTMGATGLDFQSVSGGTCVVGQAYPANGSCTVLVTFTPQVTGTRRGAVVVENKTTGWTTFIYGTGAASQITFDPGTQTTITTSEVASNLHLAQDGNGNIFYTNPAAGSVMKRTAAGVVSTYVSGLGNTIGTVAVDGTGSLFIALPGKVYVRSPNNYVEYIVVGGATDTASAIAIDPTTGNRYIADSVTETVYESQFFGGAISTFLSGSVLGKKLDSIRGLAVDGAGTVYVSDMGNGRVLTIQQGTVTSFWPGYFKAPYQVAVGGNGDVFVADSRDKVTEITPRGAVITNYTNSALGTDVSVDGYENLLVSVTASNGTENLVALNRGAPPTFNFAPTPVGSTSSDSPKILTITDMGTDDLVFPAPQNTNSGLTKGFNLSNATTCPDEFNPGTPLTSLPSGYICTYAINFSPTTSGVYAGSMTLPDNSLNVSNGEQVIPLNGTTSVPATVSLTGLSATYTGSPIAVTATTVPAGLAVSITYAGSTTPPAAAGSYAVVATVTSSGYTGSATGTLVIAKATPAIAWATPASISYGTPLSATQLDATAAVAGTFVYNPVKGTVPPVGSDTLSVTFTPTSPNYTAATKTVVQTVTAATLSNSPSFNTVSVGGESNAHAITVSLASAGTVSGIQVLTLGVSGLDFQNANGGSCVVGQAYSSGSTCTVNVTFTPQVSGFRPGAVVVQMGASGSHADFSSLPANAQTATATFTSFITGSGASPQLAFDPGTQSFIPFTIPNLPGGVVVDGAGDIYYASAPNTRNSTATITKLTPAGVSTTVISGLSSNPAGVVLDSAGNLFLGVGASLLKITPAGVSTTLVSGLAWPITAMAADPSTGNLYVTQFNSILKVTAAGVQSAFLSGTVLGSTLSNPSGLAVDTAGNVYVSDSGNNRILKVTSAGTAALLSVAGVSNPIGLAIGGTNNLYIVNQGGQGILELTSAGVQSAVLSQASVSILATQIGVDAAEDVYIADVMGQHITELNRHTPPSLSFANTYVGSISADSPAIVSVQNIGNATLTVGAPASGTNAAISSGFTFAANNTCPVLTTSSAAVPIAAGVSCHFAINFQPVVAGTDSGSLTLTDNALSVLGTQQIFPLSGTGVAPTKATVTLSGLSATYTGSPIAVIATTSPVGLSVSITYSGSATAPTKAGSYAVVATVTSAGYTGSATGTFVIAKAKPVITWATPAPIVAGTVLSATQLDATAGVPGTFVYSPAAGTTPPAGTDVLTTTFTPTDSTDYNTASATVSLTVTNPRVVWIPDYYGSLLQVRVGTTPTAITIDLPSCNPNAVAVNSNKAYVVCNASGNNPDKILVYNANTIRAAPAGTLTISPLQTITSSQFNSLIGIAFDSSNNLWVASYGNSQVDSISAGTLNTATPVVTPSLIDSPISPVSMVFDTAGGLWVVGQYAGGILLHFPLSQINAGADATPDYCLATSSGAPGCAYIDNVFLSPEGVALYGGDVWVANNSTGSNGTIPGRELVDLKFSGGTLTVNAVFGTSGSPTSAPFVCPGGLYASSSHLWVNDESYGESNPACGANGDVASMTGGVFDFTPAQLAAKTTTINQVLAFSNITGRPGFGGIFVEND
jgi:GH18 family chitinase